MDRYRKKITKSGKGAFSLYIPKKWVDGWKGEQARERNVDLIQMDDHLIISPVQKGSSKSVTLDGNSVERVRHFLLSCYVRGFESAEIASKGRFTDEEICGARTFIRALDDRLTLEVSENRIAYTKRAETALCRPDATQLQLLLFDKLIEGTRLMEELVEHFDRNPRRAIHLMQMLKLLEEDTDRLALQVLRLAARMEMPFENLVDLYYIVLTTNTMENIGDAMFGMVKDLCKIYKLDQAKLRYPIDALLGEVEKSGVRPDPSIDAFKTIYVAALKSCTGHISRLRDTVRSGNESEIGDYLCELGAFKESLAEDLGRTLKIMPSKPGGYAGQNLSHFLRIGYRIGEITARLQEYGKHSVTFHFP